MLLFPAKLTDTDEAPAGVLSVFRVLASRRSTPRTTLPLFRPPQLLTVLREAMQVEMLPVYDATIPLTLMPAMLSAVAVELLLIAMLMPLQENRPM